MNIVVYVEVTAGAVAAPSTEALTLARNLAAGDGKVTAVLVGTGSVQDQAAGLGEYGVDTVLVATDDRLERLAPSAHRRAIVAAARTTDADLVLLAATVLGRDLTGRVAAALETTAVADVTAAHHHGDDIVFTRPVYAGKAIAEVVAEGKPVVASLRPKSISAAPAAREATVSALDVTFEDKDFAGVVTAVEAKGGDRVSLADADIVVAGGRGVKGACDPEDEAGIARNFALVEQLADALGAAVGSSRAVVDAGWRPHSEQVGQTGKTVTPTLYIAVGISGAIQHLVGMRGSKHIIAINNNGDAPIFGNADLGVVGDLFELLPALTEKVQAAKG